MKELSIEEKAKRYDEAIKVAQRFYNNSVAITKKGLEDIFPELAESEDERIRKAIIEMVHDTTGDSLWVDYNVHKEDALAWLEKQGEQNHAWSEEDEKCIENAIMYCKWARDIAPNLYCYETSEKSINWLKSLKDRVQPQPQWSKMDDVRLTSTIEVLEFAHSLDSYNQYGKEDIRNNLSWLKSLKNRYTWKPSDEQIEYLSKAIFTLGNEGDCATAAELFELRDNLKMLREK